MARMKSTTLYLTEEQSQELDRLAKLTRIPKATMLRSAVDKAILDYEELFKAQEIGLREMEK